MKLQEGGSGIAGTLSDFAGVRSIGDAEQQADLQIAPEQPGELLGKFGRTSCEQSGRLGLGHDFAQGGAASLACDRVEGTCHFGGLDHLGDRQPEYGNDRGIACLANELCPERNQYLRQGLAVAQYGQISGHVESFGAPPDAGDQHFLFVANQCVKLSFGDTRARGDLEHAGRGVAAPHERVKRRIEDALANRGFVAAFLAAF